MTVGAFSSDFSAEFDVITTPDPPTPPAPGQPRVQWRLWVRAFGQDIDVTGKTRFDFTVESGRDDPQEQPQPGRATFTVDVAHSDRGIWASPGVVIWLEAASGAGEARAWRRVWTGTITEVRRRFVRRSGAPGNQITISATGPLAVLQRLKVPSGVAGAYPEQLDGERVWRLLYDLGVATSTVRPATGHLVNDELPEHASRWDATTRTVTGPTWALFNRTLALPDIVSDTHQHVLGLHNYQTQNAAQYIGEWIPMRSHKPMMSAPLTDWDTLALEGTPILYTAAGTAAGQARYATGPMSPTGALAASDALGAGSSAVPDIDVYKAWCQAVKDRAGDLIDYWEVWNEPDSAGFFRGTPHELASMTWAAWEVWGGKVVAPGWTAGVLASGRLSGWYVDDVRQTSVSFINTYFDVMKTGAAQRGVPLPFRAITYHGYGPAATITASAAERIRLWEQFKAFIRGKGVTGPLWDTEWNLRKTGGGGYPDNAATAAAFRQSVRDVAAVGVARQFFYAWTDHTGGGDDWTNTQIQLTQETPHMLAAFAAAAAEYLPVAANASRRLEVVVGVSTSRAAVLVINAAGQSSRQFWLVAGGQQSVSTAVELPADVYAPTLQIVAIPVDDTLAVIRWRDLAADTTTWAAVPATRKWTPAAAAETSTTVTLHTVDVWRSGWDLGRVWLIARDPTVDPDQTAASHVEEVGTAARGALWEQRGGGLQWVSQLSRAVDQQPSLDLPAGYVVADTESVMTLSGLVNEVTVNYGWSGLDGDGDTIPRPGVTLRDDGSIAAFEGKFAATIDGPLLGRPAATTVARQILLACSRPRERLDALQLVPLDDMTDLTITQLLTLNPGAVVQVESTPTGWVPSGAAGVWRGWVEGWTLTGSAGYRVTASLNVSELFENAAT